MPFKIVMPKMQDSELTTKDLVISVLSKEWPLSVKKIFNRIKIDYSKSVTYQSVYKSTISLFEEKLLEKNKKGYIISKKWLSETEGFVKALSNDMGKEDYSNYNFSDIFMKGSDLHMMEFKDMRKLIKFLRRFEYDLLKKNKLQSKKLFWVVNHCYKVLFHPSLEYEYLRKLNQKGVDLHILCNGTSKLDLWAKDFYEKNGAVVKTGANFGTSRHINIYDDYVIEIFFNKGFNDTLEDIHNVACSINEIDMTDILGKAYEDENNIHIIINKNPKIVNHIKSMVGYHFEKAA